MSWFALIDATRHAPPAGPGRVVAGLSLLERAVRLAKVSGASHALVLNVPEDQAVVDKILGQIDFGIELRSLCVSPAPLSALIAQAAPEIELVGFDALLYLRSSTIYNRGLIHAHPAAKGAIAGSADFLITPGGDILEIAASRWPGFVRICQKSAQDKAGEPPARGFELAEELPSAANIEHIDADKWQIRVVDEQSARAAEERLWQDCRKPVDGVISRLLNRYISLAISRRIAATKIHPNHMSVVTFGLGIIAALAAARGGYSWFLVAGLAYQANSVVDGVDGELARVKYEFSLLGEWLDTLSDDLKDVLFYAGLAVGAWRTVAPPGDLGASIWLWLGGVAVAGKLVSMVAYYSWLIANKRGDLLAFQWSFENREAAEKTAISRLLSVLKYATKNDFIVFVAMLMAFVSALPYFLFIVAPGQLVVATSVILQRLQGSER